MYGRNDVLLVPSSPHVGNWIGLCLFMVIAIICAHFGHRTATIVLCLLGLASFLTPVTYCVFDKSNGLFIVKSCNGAFKFSGVTVCPLGDITGVVLEIQRDDEGGTDYRVCITRNNEKPWCVSTHQSDARRLAEFLGVEKTVQEK